MLLLRNRVSASTVSPPSNKSTLSSPAPSSSCSGHWSIAADRVRGSNKDAVHQSAAAPGGAARGLESEIEQRTGIGISGFASTQSSRTAYYAKIEKGAASPRPFPDFQRPNFSKPRLITEN